MSKMKKDQINMSIKPLFIGSVFLIILGIIGVFSEIKMRNDYLKGNEVLVKVIEKPFDCESINSRNTFIKVQYKDQIFNKKIGKEYCDDLEKEVIRVILSPDNKAIFFKDDIESFQGEIFSSIVILIVGIFILIKAKK